MNWTEIVRDNPDNTFMAFRIYLGLYCKEMLPDNFDFNNWPSQLAREMLFACQFFTFEPQFSEPLCR